MQIKKRLFAVALTFVMIFTLLPLSSDVYAAGKIELSAKELQVTEEGTIKIKADLGRAVNSDSLIWTLGDKPLSDWNLFDMEAKDYTGDDWLKISDLKVSGSKITANLNYSYLYGVDTTDKRPNPRWTFMDILGDYEFTVTDEKTGATAVADLKINNYKGFHKHDEIKPHLDTIIANANKKGDRYFEYQSSGTSIEGRDIPVVLVAKNREVIDNYLNKTLPRALSRPQDIIEMIDSGAMGEYQVPIFINNIHPDESPGVDSQIMLLEKLANDDVIKFQTLDGQTDRLVVKDVLDDFILIFQVTQNPDGRYHNSRQNANNLDLNRDNAYQTQPETQALGAIAAKYTPIAFLDLHGFMKDFLIEPCTPPHEPNFEYDLLMGAPMNPATKDVDGAPGAIELARYMGDTAIANTKYDSYVIPMFNYGDGWDDGFLGYTGVFAMIHGCLGHTIEIPDQNYQSALAHEYTVIGAIDFIQQNKNALYKNQLEIFRRGIKNEDNRAVDTWHVNPKGEQIGRPRKGEENFFPEYYVLPVDKENQKNSLEVYNMADYLLRNGVKIYKTIANTEIDGKTYKTGSIVVPLHQAKRGLANAALFTGTDESAWGAMYAELVLNFPEMRGFDAVEIRKPDAFDGKIEEITKVERPVSKIEIETAEAVVKNTNNDAIRLVNKMVNEGKDVKLVTIGSGNISAGDYIVKTSDLKAGIENYIIDAIPANDKITSVPVEKAQVYLTPSGSNYGTLTDATRFALKDLGFEIVEDIEQATVIIDSAGTIEKEQLGGKKYIAVGSEALQELSKKEIYPFEIKSNEDYYGNEGLLKAVYSTSSPITGVYDSNDIAYIASGTVISKVPTSARIFARVCDDNNFYIQGWWPNHEFAKGQILGFADSTEETDFIFFASDLTNKAHTAHLYRQLSNSIYAIQIDSAMLGRSVH